VSPNTTLTLANTNATNPMTRYGLSTKTRVTLIN
jgi:hypothetical protein